MQRLHHCLILIIAISFSGCASVQLYEESRLFYAIEKGEKEKVIKLLDNGTDVNIKIGDKNILIPLTLAMLYNHPDIVEVLIAYGADVNARLQYGSTPLTFACAKGQITSVKLLLENGAIVNSASDNGTTALMVAASEGTGEIVKMLLEHGADKGMLNNEGKTALSIALEKGNLKAADILMQAQAKEIR